MSHKTIINKKTISWEIGEYGRSLFRIPDVKRNGELPRWESITEAELRKLYSNGDVFDVDLAKLFDVSVNKVRYKRKKYGLDYQHIRILKFFNDPRNTELKELNQRSKDRLLTIFSEMVRLKTCMLRGSYLNLI